MEVEARRLRRVIDQQLAALDGDGDPVMHQAQLSSILQHIEEVRDAIHSPDAASASTTGAFRFAGAFPATGSAAELRQRRGDHGERVVASFMEWLGYKNVRVIQAPDGGVDVEAGFGQNGRGIGQAVAQSKAHEAAVSAPLFLSFIGATTSTDRWKHYKDKDKLYFAFFFAGVSLFAFHNHADQDCVTISPENEHAKKLMQRRSHPAARPSVNDAATLPSDMMIWTSDQVQTWLREEHPGLYEQFGPVLAGTTGKGLINLYARRFKEWDSHKKSKSDAAERMRLAVLKQAIEERVQVWHRAHRSSYFELY